MSDPKNVSEAFEDDGSDTLSDLPTSPTLAVCVPQERLGDQLAAKPTGPAREILAARLSASQLLANGEDFRAADMLMKIVRLDPKDMAAQRLLASILERNDQAEAAQAIYRELLELHEENGDETLSRLTRSQLRR